MQSSDYLFHFTPKLENIFLIIENGIWVKRSEEDFSFLEDVYPDLDIEAIFGSSSLTESESKRDANYKICVPMACFCDIPIDQANRHSEIYGKYALGFNKSWGIKRGINPINSL